MSPKANEFCKIKLDILSDPPNFSLLIAVYPLVPKIYITYTGCLI